MSFSKDVKKYLYEYKLVVDDKTTCGSWSNWQKEKITATDLVKVKTKACLVKL